MNNLLTLIVATSVLVIIPGPNVALIVANSLKHGFRMGAVTVIGTTMGVASQLLLVALGLAVVVAVAVETLTWIKWAGVAYLLYLGFRTWHEPAGKLANIEAAPVMFWRGCFVALINPKTLLFNAAFLPQFVSGDWASSTGIAVVAAVYLAVLFLGDLVWAAFASRARGFIGRYGRLRNRLTGAFLVVAGVGLALARR